MDRIITLHVTDADLATLVKALEVKLEMDLDDICLYTPVSALITKEHYVAYVERRQIRHSTEANVLISYLRNKMEKANG